MRALLAAGLLSGCVTAKSAECAAHGGPAWYRVTTPHFVVSGNLSPDGLVTQAKNLERVLAAIVWVLDYPGDAGGIDAIIVGRGQLKLFEYDVVGVASGSEFVSEALDDRDLSGLIPGVSTHELTHVIARRAFPSIPRWLNEGLAEYTEVARLIDPEHIKVGAGVWGHQNALLLGHVATVDELWAWGTGEEPTGELRDRLYATAWAVVHYLTNHEREKFVEVLGAMRKGEKAKPAFARVFPKLAEVQAPAAIEHMNGGKFMSATLTLTGVPVAKAVELDGAEVHRLRGKIWNHAFRLTPERQRGELAREARLGQD